MDIKDNTYDGSQPLDNDRWELLVNLRIKHPESPNHEVYGMAGYKQTGENADKAYRRLWRGNDVVQKRYDYLIDKHNQELERSGFISREKMLADALYMKALAMGKLPVKYVSKHSKKYRDDDDNERYDEWFDEHEMYTHDIKAFTPLWDKIMTAMAYYPKDTEVDITDPKYLAKIFKKLPQEKLEVLLSELASKSD